MDGTAPSDPAAACDLPCGRSGISASWAGRDDDAGSDQAEEHGMMISLETHNPKNVAFYEHLGFKTFGVVEKAPFHLKQYCMIRELGSEKPNSL